jgi:hypothetical protein
MSEQEKTPGIMDIAAGVDVYASRRKTNRPKYAPLLAELLAFAQARAADDHNLGIEWFKKTGIPKVNALRAEKGEAPIPNDLSETCLAQWLATNHPVLREAFRR